MWQWNNQHVTSLGKRKKKRFCMENHASVNGKQVLPTFEIYFWDIRLKILTGTGAKKAKKELGKLCLHYTIFTKPKLPCQKFWTRVSSLKDMRRSIRSNYGRLSLRAVSLKKDVSQSSKLKYEHRSWQKFAGKNPLIKKKKENKETFYVSYGYNVD